MTSIVRAPAERYVVDVEFARPGTVALVNRVQALDHMRGRRAPRVRAGVRRGVLDAPMRNLPRGTTYYFVIIVPEAPNVDAESYGGRSS